MQNNLQMYAKRVKQWFNSFGMRRYLTLLALRNSERDVTLSITPVGQEGTSFTDGKRIVITLWLDIISKPFAVIKMAMEAFTAHEAEHCRSSNFKDGMRCAEEVGKYYKLKYNYNEQVGVKLGKALYNIVEDGRIEWIACNRFPGLVRGFKYINAILWKKNALDVTVERDMYSDFMAAILCLAKTGVKPKNWDLLYLKTEADDLLNQIAYIIYNATCSDFTEDVVNAVLEINKIIDPFIADALKKDSDFLDKLDEMAQDMSEAVNDAEAQESQAGSNGGGTVSINKPQEIPSQSNSSSGQNGSQSSKGAGSGSSDGANNAEDALDSATDIEKTASDIEDEVENDEEEQQNIDNRIKQNEEQQKQNSDEDVEQKDLDSLEQNSKSGLNYGRNPQIEHFQQALQESDVYEPTEDIKRDGATIYNQLKNLFTKRNDLQLKNLRRGKLDTSKLARFTAINRAGSVENRIFEKTKKAIKVSCAAYIVVDISGSTAGYVFNQELEACAKIEDGFGKLIPLKIAAYDDDCSFRFKIIRDFNNKSTDINLSYNFLKHEQAGGGTPTAEAMSLAGFEISKRKETNKLIIILTDGWPSNSESVKEECHKLRKQGIKVIPILISDSSDSGLEKEFSDMYEGKDLITEEPNRIAGRLVTILTRWITSSTFRG